MKTYFTTLFLMILFLAFISTASFAQTQWVKDTLNNPVIDPGPSGAWDAGFVGAPSVLFDGNKYHMWYWGGINYDLRGIGYATSPDGIAWTKYDDSTTTSLPYELSDPVLIPGLSGTWDDASVATPSVLLIDTTYHMWFAGSQDPTHFGLISVGHATSKDGIDWEKDTLNNPVLTAGTEGNWDDVYLFAPCVIFDGMIYHMWFNGWNGTGDQVRIGHATSPHPDSSWTKDLNNPVLSYEFGEWDYPRVDAASVIYDGNTFHMWYSGGSVFAWRIGYATSPDGIGKSWTKSSENPVLNWGPTGSWDEAVVAHCSVILDSDDSKYKMWYTGGNGVWDGHIGFASDIVDGIGDNIITNLPQGFVLSQNYPNPFNPITNIEFRIPYSKFVTLKIYNLLGKEVATLVSNKLNQGNHTYTFDGKNLASGVYYYQLVAGEFQDVKKMILLR